MAGFGEGRVSEFRGALDNAIKKVGAITYYEKHSQRTLVMPIFSQLLVDYKNKTITATVSENWAYILNSFGSKFTSYDLTEFLTLETQYSRTLYRSLKQFRRTGYFSITSNDFNYKFSPPKSYNSSRIQDRILTPTIIELTKFFPNLRVEKRKDPKQNNKIIGYEFYWDKEEHTPYDKNKYTIELPKIGEKLSDDTKYQLFNLSNGDIAAEVISMGRKIEKHTLYFFYVDPDGNLYERRKSPDDLYPVDMLVSKIELPSKLYSELREEQDKIDKKNRLEAEEIEAFWNEFYY